MLTLSTHRPRNVNTPRAAAILYGDWGTSKAYVIGLAFAVAGYSSFWLLAPMCLLTALVGINYMTICRHYPDGGGVYASVRHRSEIISIVGAFLLVADYIVTAAISALSAFQYLGVPHPEIFAAAAIGVIGALNTLGPKHTGGLAFLISVPTVVIVVLLGLFCLPHLGQAIHNLQPLHGSFSQNWSGFVGIVLALSGVEAIANATGVMRLNANSTPGKPNISKTSTPAILWVMIEVCFFTALFGLAAHALSGLQIVPATDGNDVNAPGAQGVRDYLLRYMAEIFVGGSLGVTAGHIAAWAVSIVFGFLLLSAVNTAIVDLIAISFLMSRDGELPPRFQQLNRFGVPLLGAIIAAAIPMLLVIAVKDMAGLADLYAVGVVGAIATNLGASATDKHLDLKKWERWLMGSTFAIMLAIEISLFIDKPKARVFAVTVLAIGLILRGLASERSRKKKMAIETTVITAPIEPAHSATHSDGAMRSPLICAVRGVGKTLDFALDEAKETNRPLYLLFVRVQPVMTEQDRQRKWREDKDASDIFTYAQAHADGHPVLPCYVVSDSPADSIVEIAATTGAARLILGAPQRGSLINILRGNIIRQVAANLPDEVDLIVYA
jgi:amino acid transporter/nucleotide-binding universal stress UspA family protein